MQKVTKPQAVSFLSMGWLLAGSNFPQALADNKLFNVPKLSFCCMKIQSPSTSQVPLISTDVVGLDDILGGGLRLGCVYLIEGEPGTGKTTTGLQFFMDSAQRGESVVHVTQAATAAKLTGMEACHNWNIESVHIQAVLPAENLLQLEKPHTMFHLSKVEMGTTTQLILAVIDERKPIRVVIDSRLELKLFADAPLRCRRQELALKQFFFSRSCTLMLLDDRSTPDADFQFRSFAHGVIRLKQSVQEYGAKRRRVWVVKHRCRAFRCVKHDYDIVNGSLRVHPRLVAAQSRFATTRQQLQSGLKELDALPGGGLDKSTSPLIAGPPDTGKSFPASHFACAAAGGEKSALVLLEEAAKNLLNRGDGLGMNLREPCESGVPGIQQVDPAELSPAEFLSVATATLDEVVS